MKYQKGLDKEKRRILLQSVFPDVKMLSEASKDAEVDNEVYKAMDSIGNVFFVKNPAARKFRVHEVSGMSYVEHQEPRLMMTYDEVVNGAKGKPKEPSITEDQFSKLFEGAT